MQEMCRADRYSFFRTLLESGLRQGEALHLATDDVSTDVPALTVRSQPGSRSRGKVRQVPISSELALALKSQGSLDPQSLVFTHSRSTVQQWWKELKRQIGAIGVTLHGFRATFITVALQWNTAFGSPKAGGSQQPRNDDAVLQEYFGVD